MCALLPLHFFPGKSHCTFPRFPTHHLNRFVLFFILFFLLQISIKYSMSWGNHYVPYILNKFERYRVYTTPVFKHYNSVFITTTLYEKLFHMIPFIFHNQYLNERIPCLGAYTGAWRPVI